MTYINTPLTLLIWNILSGTLEHSFNSSYISYGQDNYRLDHADINTDLKSYRLYILHHKLQNNYKMMRTTTAFLKELSAFINALSTSP